jgi:hypothetical protein
MPLWKSDVRPCGGWLVTDLHESKSRFCRVGIVMCKLVFNMVMVLIRRYGLNYAHKVVLGTSIHRLREWRVGHPS